MGQYLPTAAGFPQGLIARGSSGLALDPAGEGIYAGPVSRRDGFAKARIHPYPEVAVRKFVPFPPGLSRFRVYPAIRAVESGRHGRSHLLPFLRAVVLLPPLALAACHHLIDQTDFDPPPPVRPVVAPVPDPETRSALVTIEYAKPDPDYHATLAATIRAVESRRPGLLFDVVAVVGSDGETQMGRLRAAEVMTAVEAEGVIPARIQLGLRVDPGRKIPQVRVYLR
jgi:hypothetical protein